MKVNGALTWPVILVVFFSLSWFNVYSQKETDIIKKLHSALRDGALETPEPPFVGKGIFEIQDVKFTGALYYHNPKSRMEMNIAGATFIQFDTDTITWEYNPFEKRHTIQHKDVDAHKQEMSLAKVLDFTSRPLLYYKKHKHQLKFKSEQTIDSIQTYVLELTLKDSDIDPVTFYISKRTNLIYKSQSGNQVRWYANYKPIGNYIYPALMVVGSDGSSDMILRFDELSVGDPIPDSLFTIPKEAFDSHAKAKNTLSQLLNEADSLLGKGNFDAAIVKFNEVLNLNPNSYEAYNGRGLAKNYQKKYYESIADLNIAVEINPEGSTALNNRGLAKYNLGDKSGALEDYTEALKFDSTLGVTYKNRGMLYFRQSEYKKAENDFTKATILLPEDGNAVFKLGVAVAQLERYEEALVHYSKAVELNYLTDELYNYRGVSEYKLQKFKEAANAFREAIKKNNDNLQYVENLGNALFKLEEYSEAIAVFEGYLKKNSQHAEIYNMIGLCHYREEEYKGAIINFTKALELNGKMSVYFENRADAKRQIEDYEGSITDYTQAISVNPSDSELFYKRGMAKIRSSKKLEGCLDLSTAYDMKYEDAKEAIMNNCN